MIETQKGFTPTPIIAKLPKAKRKAHRNDWCRGFTPTPIVTKLSKGQLKAHRNDLCRGFTPAPFVTTLPRGNAQSASQQKVSGFTLIEIVIVMAISAFIIVGFFSVYSNFNKEKSFEFAVQGVANLLKEAKSNTLASRDASVYGVHLETGRAVLFKGNTFSEPNADNREYTMPTDVELSSINLNGGGNDIIFNRLTGETQQFGTTTISRVSDATIMQDIVVSQTGVVEY